MLLEEHEKERFIAWLENEARSGKTMIEQFAKIPSPATNAMAEKEKQKVAACLIILNDLKSGEMMSISSDQLNTWRDNK